MTDEKEWFKDAIIYQIFVDRFAEADPNKSKKPVFAGGNLKAIIKKLPYLKELGINTIWLSPFYKTSAYHGYHVTDLFKVEPHFGNLKDLKELIKKTHQMKIRIIADFTANHLSHKHPFFLSAQKSKNSKYYNWFIFKKWPEDYMCFLSFKDIAKINLNYAPARDHVIKAAKYWLSLGFDGYRLDHVAGPDHKFWKYFRKEIKTDFPDSVLIGEACMFGIKFKELKTLGIKNKFLNWIFKDSSDLLMKQYIKELDGVLDFRFQNLMKKFIAKKNLFKPKWLLRLKLRNHYKNYPKDFFLPSFLDNHDMNRLLHETKQDKNKLKQAAKIQFSIKQPVIIYQGTEQGSTHVKSISDISFHGDLLTRQPIDWNNQDIELFNFYKNLIKKRNKQF